MVGSEITTNDVGQKAEACFVSAMCFEIVKPLLEYVVHLGEQVKDTMDFGAATGNVVVGSVWVYDHKSFRLLVSERRISVLQENQHINSVNDMASREIIVNSTDGLPY